MNKIGFIEVLLNSNVLQFGKFTTKSGRESPYFFNTGNIDSGMRISAAAIFYADLIAKRFGTKVENLFGPAYKGIPLCVAVADKLSLTLNRDVSFTFNRKEKKSHGEGGLFVGRSYHGGEKVIIVEDVLTGGTSLRESLALLKPLKVEVLAAVVGIDRQEQGTRPGLSARREIEEDFGVPVFPIVNIREIQELLLDRPVKGKVWIDQAQKRFIDEYLGKYGAD